MSNRLTEAYERLFDAFGPQQWWPAESAFEVMVGAVLTQNTSWKNVEKAVAALRHAGLLGARAIYDLRIEELSELIRSAGYYRLKARRLKNLVSVIVEEFSSDVALMFRLGRDQLRERLLQVNGIGPETADSIVLYAAGLPVFVVDNYTARILKRHGWVDMDADYHQLQDEFHGALREDVQLFNEYHALIVRVGKDYCGRTPKCDSCPLNAMLPPDGPLLFDR